MKQVSFLVLIYGGSAGLYAFFELRSSRQLFLCHPDMVERRPPACDEGPRASDERLPSDFVEVRILRVDAQRQRIEVRLSFWPIAYFDNSRQSGDAAVPSKRWEVEFFGGVDGRTTNIYRAKSGLGMATINESSSWTGAVTSEVIDLRLEESPLASLYPFDRYEFKFGGFIRQYDRSFYEKTAAVRALRIVSNDPNVRLQALRQVDVGYVSTGPRGRAAEIIGRFSLLRPSAVRVFAIHVLLIALLSLCGLVYLAGHGRLQTQLAAGFGYVVLFIQVRNVLNAGTDLFPTLLDYATFILFGIVTAILVVGSLRTASTTMDSGSK
jgi:hypothetical protein